MELTLTDFVVAVVLGAFILVPIFAMISRGLHAKVEKQARDHLVICRLCLQAFEDNSHVPIVHCPVCHAANEKGRSRRLG
jgi:hypothetical protein